MDNINLKCEFPILPEASMAQLPKLQFPTSSQEAEIRGGNENPRIRVSKHRNSSVTVQNQDGVVKSRLEDCESAINFFSNEICNLDEGNEISNKRRKPVSVDMDGEIWGSLPDELVEMVIGYFPFTTLVRARTVCKRWRSVIFSSSYHESDTPWLMLQCKDNGGLGRWFFDLAFNRWHKIEAKPFQKTVCVAASGGILCLYKEGPRVAKLYLFNPINGNRTKLPVLPGRVKLATLAMSSNSTDYRLLVVVLGRNGLMLRMHQPNSTRWTKSDIHTSPKLLKGVTDAVFCDDRLYCVTHKNWGILKMFDVRESLWKDLAVKRPRIFSVNLKKTPRLYLVESQGELLMVLRIIGPWWYGPEDEESCNEGSQEPVEVLPLVRKRVWIFKLDSARMMWTELNAIHGRILFLSRLGSKSVQATGRGNLIYFAESEESKHVVLYDVEAQSWEEFPPFPNCLDLPSVLYSHYPTEGLWFEPRMH